MKCTMCGNEIKGLAYHSPTTDKKKRCRCMICMDKSEEYKKVRKDMEEFWKGQYS